MIVYDLIPLDLKVGDKVRLYPTLEIAEITVVEPNAYWKYYIKCSLGRNVAYNKFGIVEITLPSKAYCDRWISKTLHRIIPI
jgi:hypothetical protein